MQESRKLLAERDEELAQIKSELEHYKVQVAREIANKTKIAKSLDESLSHVREMEEITQQWQLEVSVINDFIRGVPSCQGHYVLFFCR